MSLSFIDKPCPKHTRQSLNTKYYVLFKNLPYFIVRIEQKK